jgi:hypothetical protein
MKLFRKSFTIFFLLATCCASFAWAQSFRSFSPSFPNPWCLELQNRNNEFAYSGQPEGIFYCNPLMLEGEEFDYFTFGLESKGELKLIKSEAKSGKMVEIPFYLHLRRNGVPATYPCGEGVIFSKVEISDILKVALDGDELIIEPVNEEDWPAKRIVRIGDKC